LPAALTATILNHFSETSGMMTNSDGVCGRRSGRDAILAVDNGSGLLTVGAGFKIQTDQMGVDRGLDFCVSINEPADVN
jgi:hypothetical protein